MKNPECPNPAVEKARTIYHIRILLRSHDEAQRGESLKYLHSMGMIQDGMILADQDLMDLVNFDLVSHGFFQ